MGPCNETNSNMFYAPAIPRTDPCYFIISVKGILTLYDSGGNKLWTTSGGNTTITDAIDDNQYAFTLESDNGGCLEATGGDLAKLTVNACNGQSTQQWILDAERRHLVNKRYGTCVSNDKHPAANDQYPVTRECSPLAEGDTATQYDGSTRYTITSDTINTKWGHQVGQRLIFQDDRTIKSADSGKVMDWNGTELKWYDWNNTGSQFWRPKPIIDANSTIDSGILDVTAVTYPTGTTPHDKCPKMFGYDVLSQELNEGASGQDIYMCVKKGQGTRGITGVKVKSTPSSGSVTCDSGDTLVDIDLNKGAGGDTVKLCKTLGKYGNNSRFLRDIKIASDSQRASAATPPNLYTADPTDLNSGAGGKYIFMHYLTADNAEKNTTSGSGNVSASTFCTMAVGGVNYYNMDAKDSSGLFLNNSCDPTGVDNTDNTKLIRDQYIARLKDSTSNPISTIWNDANKTESQRSSRLRKFIEEMSGKENTDVDSFMTNTYCPAHPTDILCSCINAEKVPLQLDAKAKSVFPGMTTLPGACYDQQCNANLNSTYKTKSLLEKTCPSLNICSMTNTQIIALKDSSVGSLYADQINNLKQNCGFSLTETTQTDCDNPTKPFDTNCLQAWMTNAGCTNKKIDDIPTKRDAWKALNSETDVTAEIIKWGKDYPQDCCAKDSCFDVTTTTGSITSPTTPNAPSGPKLYDGTVSSSQVGIALTSSLDCTKDTCTITINGESDTYDNPTGKTKSIKCKKGDCTKTVNGVKTYLTCYDDHTCKYTDSTGKIQTIDNEIDPSLIKSKILGMDQSTVAIIVGSILGLILIGVIIAFITGGKKSQPATNMPGPATNIPPQYIHKPMGAPAMGIPVNNMSGPFTVPPQFAPQGPMPQQFIPRR
jgi:hypothetical protein